MPTSGRRIPSKPTKTLSFYVSLVMVNLPKLMPRSMP